MKKTSQSPGCCPPASAGQMRCGLRGRVKHAQVNEISSADSTESTTGMRPTVTDSLNRRGPALPGFRKSTPS